MAANVAPTVRSSIESPASFPVSLISCQRMNRVSPGAKVRPVRVIPVNAAWLAARLPFKAPFVVTNWGPVMFRAANAVDDAVDRKLAVVTPAPNSP